MPTAEEVQEVNDSLGMPYSISNWVELVVDDSCGWGVQAAGNLPLSSCPTINTRSHFTNTHKPFLGIATNTHMASLPSVKGIPQACGKWKVESGKWKVSVGQVTGRSLRVNS